MKKILFLAIAMVAALSFVLIDCTSPLSPVSPPPGADPYPAGFETFINTSIENGTLALNSVNFTSRGELTGYDQKLEEKNGYYGDLLEGQWVNGQWLDGSWINGGTLVTGEWKHGVLVENTVVTQGKYDGTQSLTYNNGTSIGQPQSITDNSKKTLGTFTLRDNGGSNPKNLKMELILADSYNKIVTIKITTTTNGEFNFHGLYQNGKVGNDDMLFSVRSNESKITFEISIEDWDGTYSCTETNDSDPAYFIVDKLVYTIGGKTVKLGNEGYSYIEVNNTTILVLNNGTDNVFEADNGDYVPGNAGLYALGDSSIFLFSDNDADQIFITSEGNYSEVTGVEGVDYVNIDNGKDKGILFPVDPDSDPSVPFYVDDNGPYTDSVEVDDLTKPNYDLITEQAFDLTIEFNSEAVKIGTGLIEFDGDEQLTVTYTLDTAFTTLLESFDSLSLSCNGVLAVSNQVFLGYNYNEDNDPMILDSVFALNVATPI